MGTRAMYSFVEGESAIHVYKHWDGYPKGAAEFISNARALAWEWPRFEADEFAAAFVAANKTAAGDFRLVPQGMSWDRFAFDIEYHYLVSKRDGHLHVEAFEINFSNDAGVHHGDRVFGGSIESMMEEFCQ